MTTIKKVTIPPFGQTELKGVTKIKGHSKWVHVIAAPPDSSFSENVVATITYIVIKPVSSQVGICLHNLSCKQVVIPTQVVIGQV